MTLSADEKLEIHELMSRAAYAYDERDVGMLAACFAEDAVFTMRIAGGELVGPFEGRDGIMGLMTGSMEEQTDVRRHVISNLFFVPGVESSEVVSNLTLFATESENIQLLSAGVYRDVVTRSENGWVISQRHIDLDKPY